MYSSEDLAGNLKNKNSKDYRLASQLSEADIEAWNMYINKSNGIMPQNYHWSYEQGDTLIYQEHIADLNTIDRMFSNRQKYREGKKRQDEETKALQQKLRAGQNTISKNKGGGSQFYGKKFVYKK
jgi:hypothetical protein